MMMRKLGTTFWIYKRNTSRRKTVKLHQIHREGFQGSPVDQKCQVGAQVSKYVEIMCDLFRHQVCNKKCGENSYGQFRESQKLVAAVSWFVG